MPLGDSTYWYTNFWSFLAEYLSHVYKNNYCLSAEISLDIHTAINTIPKQVIVIVKSGGGNVLEFPFDTSIITYQDANMLPEATTEVNGLNVMTLPYALCKATPIFYRNNPQEAEIALRMIPSATLLLEVIHKYRLKTAGDRLLGAYAFLKDHAMFEDLKFGLEAIGSNVDPINPFQHFKPITSHKQIAPHVNRIVSMWEQYRSVILDYFPTSSLTVNKKQVFFKRLAMIYKQDAYNSLSIEGFDVNEALIEKVKNQEWDPEDTGDNELKNALAAKGYYLAFQTVKQSIKKIFQGKNAGKVIKEDLKLWYKTLFSRFVMVQILDPIDLVRYRTHQVYIRNSRHVPLPVHALHESMEVFFDCLVNEKEAAVKAILGYFIFVYIHPYMDGNGRLGRFLMNAMFASEGFAWTIIHVKRRATYFKALEEASTNKNIKPLTQFILSEQKNGA